jgi:hypothetical protein
VRLAVLAVGAALIAIMAVVITRDLIAVPSDRWAALCFASGSLAGATWQRYGRRRR